MIVIVYTLYSAQSGDKGWFKERVSIDNLSLGTVHWLLYTIEPHVLYSTLIFYKVFYELSLHTLR